MENENFPIELKFVAETGIFEGYASVFDVVDHVGDRIIRGAFSKTLAHIAQSGSYPPMLWQHERTLPIGAWREMREDARGLYVKGELFIEDIALAREARRLLREQVVTGLSIGYHAKKSHRDDEGVRVLTEVELLEVSLVTFPANEEARVLDTDDDAGLKALIARIDAQTEALRAQMLARAFTRI